MVTKKEYMSIIGGYCRKFRINELEMTLEEVASGDNVKTLSAFEHGKSSNIEHLIKYVKQCKTYEAKVAFLEGLIIVIEGD